MQFYENKKLIGFLFQVTMKRTVQQHKLFWMCWFAKELDCVYSHYLPLSWSVLFFIICRYHFLTITSRWLEVFKLMMDWNSIIRWYLFIDLEISMGMVMWTWWRKNVSHGKSNQCNIQYQLLDRLDWVFYQIWSWPWNQNGYCSGAKIILL